ncbi:hypothetical protein DSUL_60295 [Desulfovibrionales bacterium]
MTPLGIFNGGIVHGAINANVSRIPNILLYKFTVTPLSIKVA